MLPFNVWAQSLWETLYMVGFSLIIGSIVGFFIAIVLWLTRKGGLKENPLLYTILSTSSEAHRLSSFWYV